MKPRAATKRIMGIDPGTNRMGYGVIDICGKEISYVVMGDIELSKLGDPYRKLKHIFDRVCALIDEYKPEEVALESPFFGENVQSMLKLGRAQGVAIAAALTKNINVYEYAPRRIKQSITGRGGASKEQVASMLKSILGVEYNIKRLDATDGLAVALCHHFEMSSAIAGVGDKVNALGGGMKASTRKGSSSWESFAAKNSDRIISEKAKKPK